jgi:hypothetical protein
MKKCRKALCFALVFSMIAIMSVAASVHPLAAAVTTPMLAAGGNHIIALKDDGAVFAWGDNSNGILGAGQFGGVRPPI